MGRWTDGQTDGGIRNLKGRKGVPWPGKVCRARSPPTCTEGGRCQSSVLPRRASATAPCSAGPLQSATRWWTPPRTWPPAPRTCVAAPPALVPPSQSTPASAPTRGDSPRTGGARTSAVSGPRPGPAPGPTPTPGPWGWGRDPWAGHPASGWGPGTVSREGGQENRKGTWEAQREDPAWVQGAELTPEARRAQGGCPGGIAPQAPLPAASPEVSWGPGQAGPSLPRRGAP